MSKKTIASLWVAAVALLITACGDVAQLPVSAGFGPNPELPPPNPSLIPTVKIAPVKGWQEGMKPTAGQGLTVNAFADGLAHPRWIYVLPNNDVLVAESDAPPKPEDEQGIKGRLMKWVMKQAGSGVYNANRITLLRDQNGDGVAEVRTAFLENLNSPFGMALIGNDFYVANTDAVLRFPYKEGDTRITAPGTKITDLPAGPLNHHWTKNIIPSPDGSKLYATVGSNSNVAENGMDQEEGRAAIWEIDLKTGNHRVYASGLRNPNGMAWETDSNMLWTVVNERDEIGSDLVPDYMAAVQDGSFFGWPYSYFGRHVDERVQPQRPDLVAKAKVPDYALGTHTASLGLAFNKDTSWPQPFSDGAFVGQHGSWNRNPRSGYSVIFVPFKAGKPAGLPVDVLTGFISPDGEAYGRPVGVALAKPSALYVADDVGNTVWRVSMPSAPGGLVQYR